MNLQEGNFATLRPAPTSAQDGLDPLKLALVLICMRTHTNEYVLQLPLCGGGCMYVVVILCSVQCEGSHLCVCHCVLWL